MSKLQQFIEQEKLYRNEGSKGVSNLCKIVAAIGYHDPMYNGSLSEGGNLGDLMVFLEDNPGAIDAIVSWIDKQRSDEWDEELTSQLESDEDDEDECDDDIES